jgi:ribosomal protein L11 methyltransferase
MDETNKKSWPCIAVTAAADAVEAIEFGFNEAGAAATSVDGLRKKPGEPVDVQAFFDTEPDLEKVRDILAEALRVYGLKQDSISDVHLVEVEETDWLAEWKKHWKPTAVGRFLIAPPWEKPDGDNKIVIRIEPNMAFGTGTHETTQLCLAELDRSYSRGKSLIDVGTGTGILAIAAATLNNGEGADIRACDTDEDSVKIAADNAKLNGVGGKIIFEKGSVDGIEKHADVVVANLTLDVIEPILARLAELADELLILSGILAEQRSAVEASLAELGLTHFRVDQKGEWIAVVIETTPN